MDLKQPLAFPIKGVGAQGASYPTKETINLVEVDSGRMGRVTQIALFIVVLALVVIFAKFAVIDPLSTGMKSSARLAQAEEQLAQLKEGNADYTQVNEEYSRYVVTGLTDEEQDLVDRDTVLDLLETKVMNVGHLSSVKVESNTATVTLLGANLDDVSQLVEALKGDARVAYVTVSTAQGETDASTSATIVIAFKGAQDSAVQETASQGASSVSSALGVSAQREGAQ